METAVYCRVSTDEQKLEGYSIRGQVEKLKAYISVRSWVVYEVYLDEGISGKNISEHSFVCPARVVGVCVSKNITAGKVKKRCY
jgi:hypothetical protein